MSQLNLEKLSILGPLDPASSMARSPDAELGLHGVFDEHLARAGRADKPADTDRRPSDRPNADDETPAAKTQQDNARPSEPGEDDPDRDNTPDAQEAAEAAAAPPADATSPDSEPSEHESPVQALAAEMTATIAEHDTQPTQSHLPLNSGTSGTEDTQTDADAKTPAGQAEPLLEEQRASQSGPGETDAQTRGEPADRSAENAVVVPPQTSGTNPAATDAPAATASRSGPREASRAASPSAPDSQAAVATAVVSEPADQDAAIAQIAAAEPQNRTDADANLTQPAPADARSTDGAGLTSPETAAAGATESQAGTQATSETARPAAAPETQNGPPTDQIDRVRFVGRIAQALSAAAGRDGSLRLRLHPPHLGSLRLEMTLDNGVLTARLEAESAAARNLLLDNLPALRERLAEQDIKVQRFDVELGMRDSGGSPQGPGQQQHGDQNPSQPESTTGAAADAEADRAASGRPAGPSQFDVTI